MTRREDWPERLLDIVARHDALAFGWGVSDCYLLPMDAVLAMTGAEPWPGVRGGYTSEIGAGKLLRQRGFANVADAFASAFPEVPPALAGRGDLGVVKVPEGSGFAGVVCIGTGFVGKHADRPGNIRIPRAFVLRAFRV
ncbi:DUF6950 family protein [uncultured Enterovirga sp.]|uniref:DUF6950 family protein n=1 Tax=uncultured Enterovirga sp. TaxID=2026352 RepID=UPI0035CC27A2